MFSLIVVVSLANSYPGQFSCLSIFLSPQKNPYRQGMACQSQQVQKCIYWKHICIFTLKNHIARLGGNKVLGNKVSMFLEIPESTHYCRYLKKAASINMLLILLQQRFSMRIHCTVSSLPTYLLCLLSLSAAISQAQVAKTPTSELQKS